MSAIRVSVPGQAPRLIDLGPGRARSRGYGGSPIVGESTHARDLRLQRESMARRRAPKRDDAS